MTDATPAPLTPATASAVKERLVFGFNTYYGDLLASVAKSDEMLKKRLKRHYRVLDRKSDAYLTEFYRSANELGALGRIFDEGCEGDAAVADLLVARGMRFKDLPPSEFPTVRLLGAFAWLFGELCAATSAVAPDDGDRESAVVAVNDLFERLIENVSRVQSGLSWGSALEGVVDEEAREVFRATLSKLSEAASRPHQGGLGEADVESMTDAFNMMNCSKLGSIVKEISETIDKDQLRRAVESGDMMGKNNIDLMGNLFKQVSCAITGKLQSGELSQEDLLKETSSLMASMRGAV